MNTIPIEEMAKMQFTRVKGISLSDYDLDIELFNAVSALDGVKDLHTIAKEGSYNLSDLCKRITILQDLGVVEALHGEKRYVSKETAALLVKHLSDSVGPVASLIFDDTASTLGHGRERIPIHELPELINRLGKSITDKNQITAFRQATAFLTANDQQ